jgi:hypothetical protein
MLQRPLQLFASLFGGSAACRAALAVGRTGKFDGCLLLALAGCLCVQALVEHFAGKGQPGRVEACVVHLPIMSLDLNQVRCSH